MKSFFCLLAASLMALPMLATAAPDLDAVITYETRLTDQNGLTKTSHYQERFLRRPGTVWAERVLPTGAKPVRNPNSAVNALGQHDDIDYGAASRYMTLDAKQQMQLACIDVPHTMVVQVPKNNWELVGFADNWASANALVEPAGLASMKKTARASPVKGAEWHEETQGDRYVRILWSPTLQMALAIESGTADGREWRSTRVKPMPLTPAAQLPWLGLARLEQHSYEDFLD